MLIYPNILHNILKGLGAPITVYIDTKHCELEQCNGSLALDTKSCKDNGHLALALPIQGKLVLRLPRHCAGQTRASPGAWGSLSATWAKGNTNARFSLLIVIIILLLIIKILIFIPQMIIFLVFILLIINKIIIFITQIILFFI